MSYDAVTQYIDLLLKNRRPEPLFYGCEGFWVRMLHRLLARHGYMSAVYLNPNADVHDGYDTTTVNAVQEFQRGYGLCVDGEVGSETWAWLGCADVDEFGECTLAFARQEFLDGAREIGGNNKGDYVQKYLKGTGMGDVAWCAAFATWCIIQANGGRKIFAERLSSSRLVREAVKMGAFTSNRLNAAPGDLVIIKGGSTGWKHTAILQKVDAQYAYVIEGNVRGGDSIEPKYRIPGTRDAVRHGKYALNQVAFVLVDPE